MELESSAYPNIADAIQLLQNWDRRASLDSEAMPLFVLSMTALWDKLKSVGVTLPIAKFLNF